MADKGDFWATGLRHESSGGDPSRPALDATDLAILAILQEQGRVPNNELADRVHLTPAPCLRRVRRLEELGVITGYAARLEPRAVGRGLCVFVEITLDKQTRDVVDRFEPAVAALPEVLECHLITGDADYLLKIAVRDLDDYQSFLVDTLIRVPGIADVKTVISMKEVKRASALPLTRGE
jgi:Lrp/AsnC family leucine-responsive transcriptional regulator